MDKRITRMANTGATRVLMFNKWWPLTPGTWRVDNRAKKLIQTSTRRRMIVGGQIRGEYAEGL